MEGAALWGEVTQESEKALPGKTPLPLPAQHPPQRLPALFLWAPGGFQKGLGGGVSIFTLSTPGIGPAAEGCPRQVPGPVQERI